MLMLTKTHDDAMERVTKYIRALEDKCAEYKQERDEARAKIARMTGGLRQNRKSAKD